MEELLGDYKKSLMENKLEKTRIFLSSKNMDTQTIDTFSTRLESASKKEDFDSLNNDMNTYLTVDSNLNVEEIDSILDPKVFASTKMYTTIQKQTSDLRDRYKGFSRKSKARSKSRGRRSLRSEDNWRRPPNVEVLPQLRETSKEKSTEEISGKILSDANIDLEKYDPFEDIVERRKYIRNKRGPRGKLKERRYYYKIGNLFSFAPLLNFLNTKYGFFILVIILLTIIITIIFLIISDDDE